ncbi:histidine phosphatase family protein [Desulfoscipio gibsoniae]|uniref:Fructose-2,6-bisphosphatase n=1 Tax=Desulfoscipio gibsoniae DSM 7213 TaxID=767817 RepID=R4KH50_9FIRM|nr:histidine phosphatase family protein [Desulfoscipio gibsoniae]AGK99864.1 fructose-2,6-bisphosphatase [Desulfoscipio gibsoniae DSM 7213]
MLIYLVRHGEIDTGRQKRFIGQIDLPLTSAGVRQAEMLRDRLAGITLAGIYCSDLSRSLLTAQIIAEVHSVSPVADIDLREICLGEWEGRSFADMRQKNPAEFARRGADIAGYIPPGGESFSAFSCRIMTAFNRLVNSVDGDLLLVGHAGVNRVIISQLLGMPLHNIFHICQDYGCLNILYRNNGGYRLKLLNSLEHIDRSLFCK